MSSNLRNKTINGFIWSTIDSLSVQIVLFIIGIVLARLLSPSDFGIIGMLGIFIAVSNSLIDSGFGQALVQKENRNEDDYSTVFYYNIFVGLTVYFILYFVSPYVASFYSMPLLEPITKVIGINLIFGSLVQVQVAKLTIELNFKSLTIARFSASFISGVVAVLLAYRNWGVWSLVSQTLINGFLFAILIWIFAHWLPKNGFSVVSFKQLFAFGSNLLITGIYGPIFSNINSIVIGKFFSASTLGLYSRAQSLVDLPAGNITNIISRVSLPVLSSMQDDNERMVNSYRQLIKKSYFVIFPVMGGILITAESIVRILLSDKWLDCSPYISILCIAYSFYALGSYNISILLVKGKSGLHLKLDFIKKVVSLLILSVTVWWGVKAICWGTVVANLFSWLITAHYSGKIIGLSLFNQLSDISISFVISIVMCVCLWLESFVFADYIFLFVMQLLSGFSLYLVLSYKYNAEGFEVIRLLLNQVKK